MFYSLRSLDRTDILSVLSTFATVRKRMISWKKESVPSLQILARDAVLVGLINTSQERLVSAVVAKLGELDISTAGRKALLAKVKSVLF